MKSLILSFVVLLSQFAVAADKKPVTDPIEIQVKRVAHAFEGYSTYPVSSSDPQEMLKQYVAAFNRGDEEMIKEFKIIMTPGQMKQDVAEVGTLSSQSAVDEVLFQLMSDDMLDAAQEDGKTALEYIKKLQQARYGLQFAKEAGALFGYNGFAQNGCAAPTPYLLVLNPKAKVIYGINLYPCEE